MDGFPLGFQKFLDATQKYYQADLKAIDFIGAPEECRAEINTWVEQQTESEKFHLNRTPSFWTYSTFNARIS